MLRPWWPRRRRSVTSPTGIPIFTLLSPEGCSPRRGILCIFRTSDVTGRQISGVDQLLINVTLSRKFLSVAADRIFIREFFAFLQDKSSGNILTK